MAFMSSKADTLLNRTFAALDTQGHAALIQFLTQFPLQVNCTSPSLSLLCTIINHRISFNTQLFTHLTSEVKPAITISGDAHALISLARSSKGIIPEGIHIEGQVHALEKLQTILAQIDIDWPALVEQLIGPNPTHIMSSFIQKVVQFGQQNTSQFYADATDYIIEEKRYLITRTDFTLHRQHLSDLRLKLDRADAKLNYLSQQLRTSAK